MREREVTKDHEELWEVIEMFIISVIVISGYICTCQNIPNCVL